MVYRARLMAPHGFSKDVALKLLHPGECAPNVLARFRDEARILGLLRDRAIVAVDPPALLEGQWALVMEYVDGASCAALRARSPLPAPVALAIVSEVARALDVAWHQPGPDGEPLRLLHRDLKPANVQVTPTGQVKILDFGIARARFAERESATTAHLVGTPRYIAPERLRGEEGPAADVFSLGVLLQEMLPPDATEARALAAAMQAATPGDRPTARAVEEQAEALAKAVGSPTLRQWAAQHVPHAALPPDAQVGRTLTQTVEATWDEVSPAAQRRAWVAPAAVVAAVLLVAAAAWWLRPAPVPLSAALRQPFLDFVMERDAAVSERTALRDPAQWDPTIYDGVVRGVRRLVRDDEAWQRMDQQWATWGQVVTALRDAGLPEVVAGIPWVESHYTPELQSRMCAKGLWQFMPETAHHSGPIYGAPLEVADCRFTDAPGILWSPTTLTLPNPPPYIKDGQCRIPARHGCAVDERTDVGKSTAAAIAALKQAWSDVDFRASGAVVQLTVAAHYDGYDDAAFDVPHPGNVRPNYLAWAQAHPDEEHPRFFDGIARCVQDPMCQTNVPSETVDYVAQVIAAQFVAVCYYAASYADHAPFTAYEKYTDGYCRALDVPSRAEVARREQQP